tara:strand:+ start:2575 stop:3195 length:621 start_codon:yes stop_codon:yes gene_type:complete
MGDSDTGNEVYTKVNNSLMYKYSIFFIPHMYIFFFILYSLTSASGYQEDGILKPIFLIIILIISNLLSLVAGNYSELNPHLKDKKNSLFCNSANVSTLNIFTVTISYILFPICYKIFSLGEDTASSNFVIFIILTFVFYFLYMYHIITYCNFPYPNLSPTYFSVLFSIAFGCGAGWLVFTMFPKNIIDFNSPSITVIKKCPENCEN